MSAIHTIRNGVTGLPMPRSIDWLVLDQWEAQKSRLRKATSGDVELALSLDRNTHLHDGDILLWNEGDKCAVVARVHLKEVMVIDLASVIGEDGNAIVRTVFELGHALGNQHWPAVVKETKVFVPLTVDRKVMASVMKTHNLPGVTYGSCPARTLSPIWPRTKRGVFSAERIPSAIAWSSARAGASSP